MKSNSVVLCNNLRWTDGLHFHSQGVVDSVVNVVEWQLNIRRQAEQTTVERDLGM
jgi:hypothetical protein